MKLIHYNSILCRKIHFILVFLFYGRCRGIETKNTDQGKIVGAREFNLNSVKKANNKIKGIGKYSTILLNFTKIYNIILLYVYRKSNDAKKLISLLNNQTSIVNLYYTKPNIHSGKNIPLVMMVFVNQTYYVVSFNHPDAINIPIEFLNLVYETNGKKLIFDRKKLKYHVPKFKNCVDATICSYLSLKSELDGNYIDSRVKDFRSVPIMILFKHFKKPMSIRRRY